MTYSNRPTASPYQHRSQFAKANDAVLMNKINTFVVGDQMSLPGTWSAPYQFEKHSSHKEVEKTPPEERSPICNGHITAGDNTIALCKPTPPNCPMSRPLEPQRDINPGMWHYYDKVEQKIKETSKDKKSSLIIVLLILIVFILFSKS